MPELPEVQTTCDGILPYLKQQTIEEVVVRTPKLRWPIPQNLKQILLHQKILNVSRRAKYIIIHLTQGYLMIHLGMSGHLRILKETLLPAKHDHIDIILENGHILRYNDPRRFGAFLYTEDLEHFPLFQKLGPEPLSEAFNSQYLLESCRNKTVPIKNHIMNQHIVVGVGNIYASEALFLAHIHPLRQAESIQLEELEALVQAIQLILKEAIRQGGTSISDYMNSEGKPGYFSQQLKVYQREGKPCLVCQTPIQSLRIGQRSSFFCPRCQLAF
ncbi:MAG TPA: DNA-formamidopyrimidine glycosylase [Legionellales bacterium]|nr:DNA-formamidopyrimidine glycosylase [Legionellales bacterium]